MSTQKWEFRTASFVVFGGTSVLVSISAAPIDIPAVRAQGSLFSASSPALVISRLFDDSHSNKCEGTYRCGFELHFADDFHVRFGHLHVFFGKRHYLLFKTEDAEAERGWVTSQGHMARRRQVQRVGQEPTEFRLTFEAVFLSPG